MLNNWENIKSAVSQGMQGRTPIWALASGVGGYVSGAATHAVTKSIALAATASVSGGVVAGGVVGAGQAYYGAMKAIGYGSFKNPGHAMNFGFEPDSILDKSHGDWAGAARFKGWGGYVDIAEDGAARLGGLTPEVQGMLGKGMSWDRFKAHLPGNWLGLGANAFFAYQGYQENGFSGAYDAIALNAATEASLFRWGYGVASPYKVGTGSLPSGLKLAGSPLKIGTSTALLRGMGAGLGGYIGQQLGLATGIPMAGTLGAAAGAYIGGAPLRAMGANPLLVGGSLAAGTAALASYGAYSVIKTAGQMAYAHRQSMRGINTDGSMASFMTQNAMTMRERSVQAIAKSHLNARSAIGMEANFMHSPRNYNSRYR